MVAWRCGICPVTQKNTLLWETLKRRCDVQQTARQCPSVLQQDPCSSREAEENNRRAWGVASIPQQGRWQKGHSANQSMRKDRKILINQEVIKTEASCSFWAWAQHTAMKQPPVAAALLGCEREERAKVVVLPGRNTGKSECLSLTEPATARHTDVQGWVWGNIHLAVSDSASEGEVQVVQCTALPAPLGQACVCLCPRLSSVVCLFANPARCDFVYVNAWQPT